ncbi:hypothetical protein DFQ10_109150 [Winogradskyella eximia]|jgi:hypothetical protein|uniref:Glycine dehydrogenase n=1 Tax=Winogradskyella eximia TaxID=262006 RepID=A0A3D9GZ64_9FLAO|nr:hypothetical protein [Winogradskyella eximia]RED42255.1 hypothetical protein DFQ10_109150 [Winogradskyella eximia]|tara:strand:+ start:734 stop:1000 length:267 start_codon:yes stop_codon:yes gene_type:complete
MKKSFLFINCDEAKHICDKVQYGEASSWERFKLNIRLAYCHITKSYSTKNSKLTESIEKAEVKCLKAEERNKIENQFKAELAKQQQNH